MSESVDNRGSSRRQLHLVLDDAGLTCWQRPVVLLAERDQSSMRQLSRFRGLAVERATCVASALAVIRGRQRLALALVDFDLHDGCAFPLLRALGQHRPDVPRILMSRTVEVRQLRGADLAHLFLRKPFEHAVLECILRAHRVLDGLEY